MESELDFVSRFQTGRTLIQSMEKVLCEESGKELREAFSISWGNKFLLAKSG